MTELSDEDMFKVGKSIESIEKMARDLGIEEDEVDYFVKTYLAQGLAKYMGMKDYLFVVGYHNKSMVGKKVVKKKTSKH